MRKCWGIRHLRYVWHVYQCHRHVQRYGHLAAQADARIVWRLDHLNAIWYGRA